jgi:phage terminase small subunit
VNDVVKLPSAKPPRAPAGLETPGRAFWRSVVEIYELGVDDTVVLEATCRTLDRIRALDVAIGDQLTVPGSKGQMVVNPLVAEQRQQRILLSRLLRQLGLPEEDSEEAKFHQSWRMRQVARARWSPDGPATATLD